MDGEKRYHNTIYIDKLCYLLGLVRKNHEFGGNELWRKPLPPLYFVLLVPNFQPLSLFCQSTEYRMGRNFSIYSIRFFVSRSAILASCLVLFHLRSRMVSKASFTPILYSYVCLDILSLGVINCTDNFIFIFMTLFMFHLAV